IDLRLLHERQGLVLRHTVAREFDGIGALGQDRENGTALRVDSSQLPRTAGRRGQDRHCNSPLQGGGLATFWKALARGARGRGGGRRLGRRSALRPRRPSHSHTGGAPPWPPLEPGGAPPWPPGGGLPAPPGLSGGEGGASAGAPPAPPCPPGAPPCPP